MWHRIQKGHLAIWRSVNHQTLCSWRANSLVKCISVSIKGIFLQLHIPYRTDIRYSRCTFGGDWLVIKDTSAEELAPFWRFICFRGRDFPHNSLLPLCVNLLETLCGCWPIIRIKICQLQSCVTGRLYVGYISKIIPEYSSAIKRTFAINNVIAVEISHKFSAIHLNSNESSGGPSGCNGGIFLKIHNFHWSHTLHKRCKYGGDRLVTKNVCIKKVASGCIFLSIAGVLLTINICHCTSIRYKCLFYCDRSLIISTILEQQCALFSDSRFP